MIVFLFKLVSFPEVSRKGKTPQYCNKTCKNLIKTFLFPFLHGQFAF